MPIWWKDIQTNQWHLGTLLTWERGFACISSGQEERPLWVPGRCVKPYHERHAQEEKADMTKGHEI